MKASNINLSFGTNVIFKDANFTINDNDKVALVGVNGAGKSTLFKVILKEEKLTSGLIDTGKIKFGYLPQEVKIESEEGTAREYIKAGRPIQTLEERLNKLYLNLAEVAESDYDLIYHKIELVEQELASYDYYNSETQFEQIVTNMNLTDSILNMEMEKLSGGQKSRVAFAKLLYSKYDGLLLDEPTNHLDSSAKEYILNYLKLYKGLVIVISHDIEFINKVINKVMYLNKSDHKIYVFEGDYDNYLKKYNELEYAKDKLISRQNKEIKELSNFVQKANAATRTNHHLKAMGNERALKLEKLEAQRIVKETKYGKIHIDITPRFPPARTPLELNDIAFGYDEDKLLFKDITFSLKGT